MKTIFVKPIPSVKVRDPHDGGHLPEGGAEVPKSSYWLRRIKDGDVVEAKKPAAARKKQGDK